MAKYDLSKLGEGWEYAGTNEHFKCFALDGGKGQTTLNQDGYVALVANTYRDLYTLSQVTLNAMALSEVKEPPKPSKVERAVAYGNANADNGFVFVVDSADVIDVWDEDDTVQLDLYLVNGQWVLDEVFEDSILRPSFLRLLADVLDILNEDE